MRNSRGNKAPEIPDIGTASFDPGTDVKEHLEVRKREIEVNETTSFDPGTDVKEHLEIRSKEIEVAEKGELSRIRVTIAQIAAAFGVVIFLIVLSTILVHYLGPTSWHWLTDDQLGKIESVLGGSGITALILTSARKYL